MPDAQCLHALLHDLADPTLSLTDLTHIHRATITQLAERAESPAFQHAASAYLALARIRTTLQSASAAHTATAALTEIAADRQAPPESRRKAAATLLKSQPTTRPQPQQQQQQQQEQSRVPRSIPKGKPRTAGTEPQPSPSGMNAGTTGCPGRCTPRPPRPTHPTPDRRHDPAPQAPAPVPAPARGTVPITTAPRQLPPAPPANAFLQTQSGGTILGEGTPTMPSNMITALTAVTLTTAAHAGLVSISGGGIIHESPDPDFPMPDQVQSNIVQGIDEQQGLVLGDSIQIADLKDLIGVVDLPAGSRVSSHLLVFDPAGLASINNVEIVFDADVIAVITADDTLFETHALFGRAGLNYPGFTNLYGFEAGSENFSVSGDRVTFSGTAQTPGDYFRVLTAVPNQGCNTADIAEPFGKHDLADITAFVNAFVGQQPIADLDSNGLHDLTDVSLFISAFVAGCP